jgi:hypothetical protein
VRLDGAHFDVKLPAIALFDSPIMTSRSTSFGLGAADERRERAYQWSGSLREV